MVTADDVQQIMVNLLSHYNVEFNIVNAGDSRIFEVSKFGVKIVYLDGHLFDDKTLKDWHVSYVHPDYDIAKSRKVIIFGLMNGGYFHYLRTNYKNTFGRLITFEGFDRILNEERKRVYKDKPKYNYMKEIMKKAEKEGSTYTLSIDPGFFDWIL